MSLKTFIKGKGYYDMEWKELVAEAHKLRLDPRLTSMKMAEGAGERDRMEIIKHLTMRDTEQSSHMTLLLTALGVVIGIIAIFVSIAR